MLQKREQAPKCGSNEEENLIVLPETPSAHALVAGSTNSADTWSCQQKTVCLQL
jgi:hypothetical protein